MKGARTLLEGYAEKCTACGICAGMCPPYSHRTADITDQEVQEQLRAYFTGEAPTGAVIERSRLCNECYRCVGDACPVGLDPMRANLVTRALLNDDGSATIPFVPPVQADSSELIAAALLTSEEEFRRITTPSVTGSGRVLFFPGCNVYMQPNLLLTAMDIMDAVSDGWAFLPGLANCCGSNYDSSGRLDEGARALRELGLAFESGDLETVILWCPTCEVRFSQAGSDLPFTTFPRYLAGRLTGEGGLEAVSGILTIHEPCKTPFAGRDPAASREVLNSVTSEPVREMARHGRGTPCCGWALDQWQPEVAREERLARFAEARAVGAEAMATICHGCQWLLDRPAETGGVRVVNYVTVVGDALGIRHEERQASLRGLEGAGAAIARLRETLGRRFDDLPFPDGRILEVVSSILLGTSGG